MLPTSFKVLDTPLPQAEACCSGLPASWEEGIDCFLSHLPSLALLEAVSYSYRVWGLERKENWKIRLLSEPGQHLKMTLWELLQVHLKALTPGDLLPTAPLFGVICSPVAHLPTHFLPQS